MDIGVKEMVIWSELMTSIKTIFYSSKFFVRLMLDYKLFEMFMLTTAWSKIMESITRGLALMTSMWKEISFGLTIVQFNSLVGHKMSPII
jgi:hypothetical protein